MRIGIALPTIARDFAARAIPEWAAAVEQHGYTSVAATDRLCYRNAEALTCLAAAAAVTDTVGLLTCVLVASARPAAVVAAQVASVDQIAGAGRLTLGLGAGTRRDDFVATGAPFETRGSRLDGMIDDMRTAWSDDGPPGHESIRPLTPGGPPILIGGLSDAAIRRAARCDGWVSGSGGVDSFVAGADRVRAEWARRERAGEPQLVAMSMFSLVPDAATAVRDTVGNYYAFLGQAIVERVIAAAVTDASSLRELCRRYADAGCDEVVFMPCSGDLRELDSLTASIDIG